LKKKSLSTVLLALVAVAALVFVVPAGAEHVDSQAGESVPISIKPWAYGFYGRAPVITSATDRTCATTDRKVAIYEMTGDHPDPAVDHKVAESERDGPARDWSMRGVDPGRRYYAEVTALTKPRCVGGRSEVVTAPPAPKPDEQAPRCAHGADHVECLYEFHGTLDTSAPGKKACGEGIHKGGGGPLCFGEYRRPDGTMGKFKFDIEKEPDGHYYAFLETNDDASGGDWVSVSGEVHSVDGDTYALEAYCSGWPPSCPSSFFPAHGEAGSRGGFLALSQTGAELKIRGYLQG
jgi:hypothetical protein